MMDAVHRYEGTVSRLMGDGLMAMFGAPVAHEDHAVRACYAALAMQQAIRAYADEARARYGVTPRRASGSAPARWWSGRSATTCTWTTRRWARRSTWPPGWSSSRGPARACFRPSTLSLVEGYVQVRSLGPVPVKGLDAPVEVYELLGVGLARTRLQVAAARGLTRFVGRDAEMSALHAALERAAGGRGRSRRWSASRGLGSRGWSGS